MDDFGGLVKTTKVERTRILPLRWIGNICEDISTTSLEKTWSLQDQGNFGYRLKFHNWVWNYVNKPYEWWGTYYKLDLSELKKDMSSPGWNDYDENGHPYWYYTEWQEDPETGDAWKLVKKV